MNVENFFYYQKKVLDVFKGSSFILIGSYTYLLTHSTKVVFVEKSYDNKSVFIWKISVFVDSIDCKRIYEDLLEDMEIEKFMKNGCVLNDFFHII